jgi:hypothetical protein
MGFAVLGEDVLDAFPGFGDDLIIDINELLPQTIGQPAPDRRFSTAAIANQSDIHTVGDYRQFGRASASSTAV